MAKRLHTDEKGSPFYIENRVDVDTLGNKDWLRWIYKAIDLYKEGLPTPIVTNIIAEQSGLSVVPVVTNLLEQAKLVIEDEYCKSNDTIMGLHITRYNNEINTLLDRDYSNYNEVTRRKLKISTYFEVLGLLYQKEKLLQLHSKKVTFRLNQKNTTTIKEKKENFNIEALTLPEKIDFLNLIAKAKRNDSELLGVIPREHESDSNIQDIEHEDVTEANIEKIKQIIPEPVPEPRQLQPIDDIQLRLQMALAEKARKALLEKGAKSEH